MKIKKGKFFEASKLVSVLIAILFITILFSAFNVRAEDPTQTGEAPTNGATGLRLTPNLYVKCVDNDTVDTMNATWWSNSSGTWELFGTNNTGFANNTNITQTNANFSTPGTTYWWRVNLSDGGNSTNANYTYNFTIDGTPPTVDAIGYSSSSTYYTDADTVTVYANFTETGSGILESSVKISIDYTTGTDVAAASMNKTVDNRWTYTWDIPSGSDGNVNVSVEARDNASLPLSGVNWSVSKYIDNTAPLTSVDSVNASGYWKNEAGNSTAVTSTVSDTLSGISTVALYCYWSNDNATWSTANLFGTDSTPWPASWNFNFPNGSGYYRFYSIGTDNVSNVESVPSLNDTECGFDTAYPNSTIGAPTDSSYYNSLTSITGTATDSYSGVSIVRITIYNSTDLRYWNGNAWAASPTTLICNGTTSWYYENTTAFPTWGNNKSYVVISNATDLAGNNESVGDINTFIFDDTSPTVAINYSSSATYLKDADTVTVYANFTEADSGINESTVKISIDYTTGTDIAAASMNKTVDNRWTYTWDIPSGSDGNVNVSVEARDNASLNLSGTNWSVSKYIDNTAPSTGVSSVNASGYWKNEAGNSTTINATVTDALSGISTVALYYYWSSNNATWSTANLFGTDSTPWPASWNFNFTNGSGYYRFYCIGTDNMSNVESAPSLNDTECGFDNVAPTGIATIPQNNGSYNASFTSITGTANGTWSGVSAVTIQIYNSTNGTYWWNGTGWQNTTYNLTVNGTTSWYFSNSTIFPVFTNGTTYYVNLTVNDTAGNSNTSADSNYFLYDTYTTEISSVSYGSLTSSTVTITWTTNENATSVVEYGTTTSYGSSSSNSSYITSHSIGLTALTENQLYHYRVTSVDRAGNSNTSADHEFTTQTQSGPPSGNHAPTADAGGPYSGYVNSTITFRGSGTDSDGTIVGYKWDFNNDETYDTDWLTTNTTTHTYTSAGTYTVKLQVKDDDGSTGTDTATVTVTESQVQKYPPAARTNGPYSKLTFQVITFDGTGSTDDGTITNYTWNLGDGTTAYGATTTHSYATAGLFNVVLTVKDNDGLTNTSTTTANITLDSDADGWSDVEEEAYGLNATNPNDYPTDTDGDGLPDNPSPDGKYLGDPDDDNDGLSDEVETMLGSNSTVESDVAAINIEGTTYFIVDTNGNDKPDKFYNPTTGANTTMELTADGNYLIDINGDGKWDHVYNPASSSVIVYTEEKPKAAEGLPIIFIAIAIVVAVIIIIIVVLFKTGYLYVEEEPAEEPKEEKLEIPKEEPAKEQETPIKKPTKPRKKK